MTDRANESDNPGKFQDIIKRRLRKGQAYSPALLRYARVHGAFRPVGRRRDSDNFRNTRFGPDAV